MGLNEAIEFMKSDFPIRTVHDALMSEIEQKATELEIAKEEMREKFEHKIGNEPNDIVQIRNWFNPAYASRIERDTAMKMAFALELNYYEADVFLKRLWLDGFYMRDAKDVIFRVGLENNWDYKQAEKMATDFVHLDKSNPNPSSNDATILVSATLGDIKSEPQLRKHLEKNSHLFGTYRRKAYDFFMEMYEEIKDNLASENHEKEAYERNAVSIAGICDAIVQDIPKLRSKEAHRTVWRHIFNKIPDRTSLSLITRQKEFRGELIPIDRKLFILAWLSTEDGRNRWYVQKGKEEIAFKEHMEQLNIHLEDFGMPVLDPRHPFDWIVMYTFSYVYFSVDDIDAEDALKDRLSEIIEGMSAVDNEGGSQQ